jgi:hypothetical protein
MSQFLSKPPLSGAVLEEGKGALYWETLQATGFYMGRIVIATAEFAPMPPFPLPGYPGGLNPTAIGMRFRRHNGIYRSDVVQQLNPEYGIQPPPARRPRAQVKERVGRNTLFSSSAMSSGRPFLDRVGRHQSPSPLHRRHQNKLFTQSEGTIYDQTVTSVLTVPEGSHPRNPMKMTQASHNESRAARSGQTWRSRSRLTV